MEQYLQKEEEAKSINGMNENKLGYQEEYIVAMCGYCHLMRSKNINPNLLNKILNIFSLVLKRSIENFEKKDIKLVFMVDNVLYSLKSLTANWSLEFTHTHIYY